VSLSVELDSFGAGIPAKKPTLHGSPDVDASAGRVALRTLTPQPEAPSGTREGHPDNGQDMSSFK